MKEKILALSLLFVFFLSIFNSCLAENEPNTKNIEVNVKGETTIKEGTKTIEFILNLGKFTGIEENIPFGYEGKLEYDTNMFKSVAVEGLGQWSAEYTPTTNKLIGDIAKVKANEDITKIVITLNDNVKPGTKGEIKLENVLFTDGENDINFNKVINVQMEQKAVAAVTPQKNEETEENKEKQTSTETTSSTGIKNQQSSDTTSTETTKTTTSTTNKNNLNNNNTEITTVKKIPKTGINTIIIASILLIVIIGVFAIIRYKTIKLK